MKKKSKRPVVEFQARTEELVRMFLESPQELAAEMEATASLLDMQLNDGSYQDDQPHIKLLAYFVRDIATVLAALFYKQAEEPQNDQPSP